MTDRQIIAVDDGASAPRSRFDVIRVRLEMPRVEGETVVFRWSQSEPNPFQTRNEFHFRYEGLELSRFSDELLLEVFLSLQLRVFAAYEQSVVVVSPVPIPRPTVDYWKAFHDADNVTIASMSDVEHYSPWATDAPPCVRRRRAGVFYGGGKDSLLARGLFSELYGDDQVVLIQFVGPLRDDPKLWKRVEDRQEVLMLAPARERSGIATQRVWSDYQAIFTRQGRHLRPHLEFYTAGALPALLEWGLEICTFSMAWGIYSTVATADGSPTFHYARSRPEVLATQALHYRRALGAAISVANVTFPFSSYLTFRLLAERYPGLFPEMISCTAARVGRRWCYDCGKCSLFAQLSLGTGHYLSTFRYDHFLRESSFAREVIELAESGAAPNEWGNVDWHPFFSHPYSYVMTCHLMEMLDIETPGLVLSEEASMNLCLQKAMWGNVSLPDHERIPRITIELLPHDIREQIRAIAQEHFELTDDIPGPHLSGNQTIGFQFDPPMATRTSSVPHIRADGTSSVLAGSFV